MGILRIYLALCVVAEHSSNFFPWAHHSGREAVQIFYLISGFYMAHISTKYKSISEFYLSRFIRIYTPYYFVLIVVILVSIFAGIIFGNWGELQPFLSQLENNGTLGMVLASLSNITLFFQDWVIFLQHNSGEALSFTTSKFLYGESSLYNYLMIPQAWSVGIELTFYLFVPLLNKQKSRTLFVVLLFVLLLRFYSYLYLGLNYDPWTYRFFPFELAIFIVGILSNRLFSCITKSKISLSLPVVRNWQGYCVFVILLFCCIYGLKIGQIFISHLIDLNSSVILSYFAWAVFIPLIFIVSAKFKYDRYIGELSYPVYLVHILVVYCLFTVMKKNGIDQSYLGILSSFGSVLFSLFIYRWVIVPVDKRRYKIASYVSKNILPKGVTTVGNRRN